MDYDKLAQQVVELEKAGTPEAETALEKLMISCILNKDFDFEVLDDKVMELLK